MHGRSRLELLGLARLNAVPTVPTHAGLLESSAHDRRLMALVAPTARANPAPLDRYDLVVVGGGTAGLVASIGAGVLGARVALVERALLGGDCLNFGCVPSKALIAAARAAHDARAASQLGVEAAPQVDFAAVMERVREARAAVAPHDALAQVESFGVQVFLGDARFVATDALEVGGARLRFRRAIIATGGRPAVPDIPGLASAGYLTSETVFACNERPAHLAILGGGPIGCELAQAFRRLGSEVTIIQSAKRLVPREDPDVADLLQRAFEREGIRVLCDARVTRVERRGADAVLSLAAGDAIACDALLVAAGRTASLEGLGLAAAGVTTREEGVVVDDRLRTSSARIFAAGDVASPFKFTHAADALARVALENALFFGRKRASALIIPRCTYTAPEIAHVGMSAADATKAPGVTTFTLPLADVDRAITEGDTEGLARVHVDRGGRIVGATLVSRDAGEMLGPVVLAMTKSLRMADLGRAIVPYPTRSEVWKRLADEHARARLTPGVQRLLAWVLRLLR